MLEMIRVFLERSGQAKLDLHLELDQGFEKITDLFYGHMHRVRSLKLTVGTDAMESMVPRIAELTQHAKTLELNHDWELDKQERDICLLRNLLFITPNVQLDALFLDYCILPWSSSLYHGLSELTITNIQTWSMGQVFEPTIWQFIDALEHCPNLKCLVLHDFAPVFGDARTHAIETRRLRFPQLRSITLTNLCFQDHENVFAMFAIGANVDLDISIDQEGDDEEEEEEEDFSDFELLPRLPPSVLIERKECESINISLHYQHSTIWSDDSNHVLDSNTQAAPPATTVSALVRSFNTYTLSIHAVRAFLKDRFWQNAHDVTIIFIRNITHRSPRMDSTTWCSFLDGLPKRARRLTIKFLYDIFGGCDAGLDEALLDTRSDGRMRLPELEQITLCYEHYSPEYTTLRLDILSRYIKERNRHMGKACKVSVLTEDES